MSIKAIKPKVLSEEGVVSANAESRDVSENPTAFDTSAHPLSAEGLLTLIASMQQQLKESQDQAAKANAALAAAILETTKPREYIKTSKELASEANEELFKKNEKEYRTREKANIKYSQNNCDHIAGGSPLSEQRDIAGRTSIVWHRNDANVDIGICTVCQRPFHPQDAPDEQGHTYTYWRKKPSFNKLSAAGTRQFQNPSKAMTDSYLRDS